MRTIIFSFIGVLILASCLNNEKKVAYNSKGEIDFLYTTVMKGDTQIMTVYYPNNILKEKARILDEKRSGKSLWYDSIGRLEQMQYYKNGVANGLYESYYPDGSLKSRSYFVDGLRQDTLKFYLEDGRLKAVNVFKDNQIYYKKIFFKDGRGPYLTVGPTIHTNKDTFDLNDTINVEFGNYYKGSEIDLTAYRLYHGLDFTKNYPDSISHYEDTLTSERNIEYKYLASYPGDLTFYAKLSQPISDTTEVIYEEVAKHIYVKGDNKE